MAETNLIVVRYGEEPSYGGTLAGAMNLINVRDITLDENPTMKAPEGLHGNFMELQGRLLANSGTGTIPTNLQFGNADKLIEGAQRNAFSSQVSITATTISFNGTTGAIADSGNGLGNVQIGDLIYVSGASTAGNNGWKGPVSAAAAGSVTVPNAQLTTEAAGASVVIKYKRCRNSTTMKWYSIEVEATDLGSSLYGSQGHVVNEMTHVLSDGNYATLDFTTQGKSPYVLGATLGTGGPTAAPSDVTFPFMNSLQDVGTVYVGGVASALIIPTLTLKQINNPGLIGGIGGTSADPKGMRLGAHGTTVDFDFYLDAAGLAVEVLAKARTVTSVWWSCTDTAGNSYAFIVPSGQFQTVSRQVGGENKSYMAKTQLRGKWNRTWSYQLGVYSHAVA